MACGGGGGQGLGVVVEAARALVPLERVACELDAAAALGGARGHLRGERRRSWVVITNPVSTSGCMGAATQPTHSPAPKLSNRSGVEGSGCVHPQRATQQPRGCENNATHATSYVAVGVRHTRERTSG